MKRSKGENSDDDEDTGILMSVNHAVVDGIVADRKGKNPNHILQSLF